MTASLTMLDTYDRSDDRARAWIARSVRLIEADARRSADTHLLKLDLPEQWGIDVYFKDESTHPTGSLKHRLARSLFLYALVNGWLREGAPVIEASSGSTAVSEAHFARLIGVPFIAVIPRGTSAEKVRLIEAAGGRCHEVGRADALSEEAARLAHELGGHFLDQFTYAERATDWRGNNNIAESVHEQLRLERHPMPAWIVVGAGTGGTSATFGRHLRYREHDTRLCVVDVEGSAFYDGWRERDGSIQGPGGSCVEGIGRPGVEASFIGDVIERMIRVPDAASIAGARLLADRFGRPVGGSTGTNLVGVAMLVNEMRASGKQGSIVTLLCDSGDRYLDTLYDDEWVSSRGIDLESWRRELEIALPKRRDQIVGV
ncbi:PLP-dependent cysteine synthase family protein [Gulosibacter macacae]|nr:PLP-dependent cysteine synthase family protein [Gulosibacter macacae]